MKTVTITKAAEMKGVARYAIHAAIKAGKLETVQVNVQQTRVVLSSLNGYQPNENMKQAGRPRANGQKSRRAARKESK